MSELDNRLRALRDELTAAIPLPDVDGVTGRFRTRRRVQLGAIVAVIAVALAVPVVRGLPVWPAADPSPAKTAYLLDFADPDHGYALTRTCSRGTVDCAFALYRTADGGESWQRRRLPHAPGDGFWDVLYVLGPDEVAVANPLGTEQTRVFSTDGGRSWGVAEELTSAGTAPLPAGGLLTAGCGAQPFHGPGCDLVGSVRPDSGQFVPVPTQPPLTPVQLGPSPTEGGRWWVVGAVPGDDSTHLALSGDGGRTWSVTALPKPPADLPYGDFGGWAVVEHGGVMYVTGGHGSSVWRSTDGGKSWQHRWAERVDEPEDARTLALRPGKLLGDPVLADDGGLTISGTAGTYVSHDQGHSFRRTGDSSGWMRWTRGGYLREQGHTFALSGDGSHWREFTVG
jgi:photosystem II stability/assembly factor-like uncharacterized protein